MSAAALFSAFPYSLKTLRRRNNIFSFWLHYSRGSDPHSLTDNTQYHDGKVDVGKSVASSAEDNWMYAYARIVYPRTMS